MSQIRLRKDNTVGYRGVTRVGTKFRAYIHLAGKQKHLGTFRKAEDAARRYDREAIKYFGEKALTNFDYTPNDDRSDSRTVNRDC